MKNKVIAITVLTIIALAIAPMVRAAEITWDGDTDTIFSNANNWAGGVAPANSTTTDKAVFGTTITTYQPVLNADRSINGLIFQKLDGGWTLGGSDYALTLGAGGITNYATSGTTTIGAKLTLGANQTWYNEGGNLTAGIVTINGNRTLTTVGNGIWSISSLDADTTARTFTKAGTGTLAITGAAGANFQNTFTLSAGTLIVGHKNALGGGLLRIGATGTGTSAFQASTDLSGANAITNTIQWINSTGNATNIFTGSQNITFSGPIFGASSGGDQKIANTMDSGAKLLFSGNFTMSTNVANITYTIVGTGHTEFSGNLSDTAGSGYVGALTVGNTGAGMTSLSGSNSYSGQTTVNSGVLLLKSANALPSSSYLLLQGGVVGLGAGDFTLPVTNTATAGYVRINGSSGFAAYGADRQVNLFGDGRAVTWNVGGFLANTAALVLGADSADKTVTFLNPVSLATAGSNIRTVQVNNGSAQIDAVLAGGIGAGGAGTNSLVKLGDGTLKLTGPSVYRGYTTIDAGKLIVANVATNGLGYTVNNAALTVDGGGFVQTPTLALGNANAYVTLLGGTTAVTQATLGLSFVSGATVDIYQGGWLALPNAANGGSPWTLSALTNIANATFLAEGGANLDTYVFLAGSGDFLDFTLITVPEPSSLMLVASGIVGMFLLRRRR